MKSIADQILDELKGTEGDVSFLPFTKEDIAKAFEQRLDKFDFDGVRVDDVEIDLEGDISVTFEDVEGDELTVLFQVDEEDDSVNAIVLDDEAEGEDDEVLLIDLTALGPTVIEVDALGVRYVNLTELSWMNKSTMTSLLQAGDIGIPSPGTAPAQKKQDAIGHSMAVDLGALEGLDLRVWLDGKTKEVEQLDERTMVVTRGGKRVKLPVVRRRRRKRLTSAQRTGLRKAAMKRKAKKSQIQRKRKQSLKLRKRLGLKRAKPGERKKFKVKG